MGFGDFLWVLIVTCIVVFLIRWGMRTDRLRLGGFAITLGAWIWAVLRPDNGGWFLFRPLPLGFTAFIFLLMIVSLVVGFFMWRLAKLIGWIAVFIAVLAPFWDLFTSELWDDLWLENWSADLFSWPVVVALATIGIILLVVGLFFRFLLVLGGLALLLALVLGLMNGVNVAPEEVAQTPPPGDNTIDRCLTIDGRDDGGVIQKKVPRGYEVDAYGVCTFVGTGEPPTVGPELVCPPHLVQRPISVQERRRFVRRGIDSATTEKSWDRLGNALLHDASSLRQMSVYFKVPDVPPLRQLLTDNGGCLSEAGVELHDDLMAVGKAMLASDFGFAPLEGSNSWIDKHGHLVIGSKQILAGNRKALVFIDSEGRERYILVRCGNPVFSTHP
jgi:hypothetical protein